MTQVKLIAKVDKMPIRNIIEHIDKGLWKLYIPSFQREFVWNEEDVRSFFDSIIRGYPIGVIILWRHRGFSIEKNDYFAEPLVDIKGNITSEEYYILDGQQRLTSLLLLYYGWRIKRAGREIKLNVPISIRPSDKKLIKSYKIGIDLHKLIKSYIDGTINEIYEKFPEYKDLIWEITNKILNYEVPFYFMETMGDLSKASVMMANAFVRINKEGVRLRGIELQLSLLGWYFKPLKKLIRDTYEPLKREYSLSPNPYWRIILDRMGLSQKGITKTISEKADKLVKDLEEKRIDIEKIVKESNKYLKLTLDLLKEELGINDLRIVPSQIALIPLAVFLSKLGISDINQLKKRHDNKTPSLAELLTNWFIVANFRGRYSSNTETKLDRDLNFIKVVESAKKELSSDKAMRFIISLFEPHNKSPLSYKPISKNELLRGNDIDCLRVAGKPYLFILYITLVKENADDWTGRLIKDIELDELTKHHIFPKNYLIENNEDAENFDENEMRVYTNKLGNLTFINSQMNSSIGDKAPRDYLRDYKKELLDKHFISLDTNLWRIEKYEEFVKKRVEILYERAKKHFPLAFR